MNPFLCSKRYIYYWEGQEHIRVHSTAGELSPCKLLWMMFQGFVSLKQEASQKAEWLRSCFYYSIFVADYFQCRLPYKRIRWQQTTVLQKEKKPPGYTNHTGGKLLTDDSNLSEGFKPKEWSCVASSSSTTDFQVTAEIARPSTKNLKYENANW